VVQWAVSVENGELVPDTLQSSQGVSVGTDGDLVPVSSHVYTVDETSQSLQTSVLGTDGLVVVSSQE
jgi:hypothetical protein